MGPNRRLNGRPVETRLELWRKRFREFSSESFTVDQFCNQVGVTAASFYYWRKKLADFDEGRPSSLRSESGRPNSASCKSRPSEDSAAVAARSEGFVPVRIARAVEVSGDVVVRLPSGAQVLIPASASELIATVIAQVCDFNAAPSIEAV